MKRRIFRGLWRAFLRLSGDANPSLETSLRHARRFWFGVMSGHLNSRGTVALVDYPPLTPELCERCVVVPRREDVLKVLPKGGRCIEVGVESGDFSRSILDLCRPETLLLIDLDLARHQVANRFAAERESGLVSLHEGDSADFLATLPDAAFDMIYIDGDHTYRGVKRDIECARTKVKPGGYLVFNDYTFWSACEGMPYGVMHAVNELCLEDGWELRYLALGECGYFDVALGRIGETPRDAQTPTVAG